MAFRVVITNFIGSSTLVTETLLTYVHIPIWESSHQQNWSLLSTVVSSSHSHKQAPANQVLRSLQAFRWLNPHLLITTYKKTKPELPVKLVINFWSQKNIKSLFSSYEDFTLFLNIVRLKVVYLLKKLQNKRSMESFGHPILCHACLVVFVHILVY